MKLNSIPFFRSSFFTLFTLFLFLALLALKLQELKAPWVDECYSYYGIWHDTFSEFYNSILTGINYSPPLYFLMNFLVQLIYPTSIETLRIQSLIWIIIGLILSFYLSRKAFGNMPAALATILIASQSDLILSQAQEARHYAMFFAFSAWALFLQSDICKNKKNHTFWLFLAHSGMCQIHYLGIIFSALIGTSFILVGRKDKITKIVPTPILLALIINSATYLFYISKQTSVLNTWEKPNRFHDLVSVYNESFLTISILVPVIIFLLVIKSKKISSQNINKIDPEKKIVLTSSFLWLITPFVFWIISHISSLNLFVSRYFIPKEVAIIFILAWVIKLILPHFSKRFASYILSIPSLTICILLLLVNFKRSSFALSQDFNYHHSLIIKKSLPTGQQPIVIEGDPKFFPNAYLGKNEYILLIKNEEAANIYKKFSPKLRIISN